MARTISEVIQRVKTSVSNDSLLYQFRGDSWTQSYTRTGLHKEWLDGEGLPTGKTYYTEVISPRITYEQVVNIFYKNTNGVWIDYTKYLNTYPSVPLLTGAVIYEDLFKVNKKYIPQTIFIDNEHFVHYIDAKDGDYSDSIHVHYIDEKNRNKVIIQPYSVTEPTLPSTAKHMMQDVRVRVINEDPSTMLVWFNGVFTPILQDQSYSDVFYIRNGMSLVNTEVYEQKSNAPVSIQPTGSYQTATVYESEEYNSYRYNFNLRIFKWDGVTVGDWTTPVSAETIPIIHDYAAVYIPKTLLFPFEVNTDAHMLFVNGIVIDPKEYSVDVHDKRKVILHNVYRQGLNLLNEMIFEINSNPVQYIGTTPLAMIRSSLIEKTYSLVNFTSSVPNKTLHLTYSKANAVDFPYRHEITFANLDLGDLVLVDGVYIPYEWVHKYTIKHPVKQFSFISQDLRIKEENVSRLAFSYSQT